MAYFDKYGAEFSDDMKDLKKVPKDYSVDRLLLYKPEEAKFK